MSLRPTNQAIIKQIPEKDQPDVLKYLLKHWPEIARDEVEMRLGKALRDLSAEKEKVAKLKDQVKELEAKILDDEIPWSDGKDVPAMPEAVQ